MSTQGVEVLGSVEAGAERGGRGAQRGVGDRDLDRSDRVEDRGGMLGLDIAERSAATRAQALDEARQREERVVVGRGAKPNRGGRVGAPALVITAKQLEVVDRRRRLGDRGVRDGVLAGDLRDGALDAAAVEEHEHAGQVVRVVEHGDLASAQRGVDDESYAADFDRRGLGVHRATGVEPEYLVDERRIGAPHVGGCEQALPALERRLAGLGVRRAVVALVEPRPPELIELVERRRLGPEPDLDLERLLDRAIEPLMPSSA